MNFDNIYSQIGHDLEKIGGGRETLMRFSKCSGNSQRISFVLGLELVRASFHEPLHLAKQEFLNYSKSEIQSTSHRVEGDGYYQKKLNWKAICFYNRSLLVGKDETLALTYANRSAVFYDTADWLHSLRDIQLSLDHGYPKHLEYKLRERQGDCWLELGQVNQALISFNLARDLLMTLSTLQQKDKLGDLVLKLKQTKNKQKKAKKFGLPDNDKISSIKSIEQEIIKKRRSAPELHRAINPLLPSASASVELINTPNRGRCLVATEDIKIGETVIVEKAHASILLDEFKESHCHHCLHWTPGPVPCHKCSQVGFCSTQCRDEAWDSYHQYECGLTDFLCRTTRDVNTGQHGLLALRTVLKADRRLIIIANEQEKSPESYASQVFDSANYDTVHRLVDNSSQRSTTDIFRRALMAVYLTSLIQIRDGKDRPDEVLATAVLRLLQSYPCNAHEISHMAIPVPSGFCSQSKSLQLQQIQSCEIGSAAFPVVSLMNHSCNPNVVHLCYGDVMVVKVIHRIARGEEILDNYGYHYATHEKRERQLKLCQQYYFRCRCQSCVEDWPLYRDTPKLTSRPDIADRITKDINNFKKLSCCYPEGSSQLEEAARLFIGHLDAMESDPSINLPVQEYNKAQEGLKLCLALLATLSPHLVF